MAVEGGYEFEDLQQQVLAGMDGTDVVLLRLINESIATRTFLLSDVGQMVLRDCMREMQRSLQILLREDQTVGQEQRALAHLRVQANTLATLSKAMSAGEQARHEFVNPGA